ncbi:hypothetical protein [Agrobacterium pusense]|uniref:hypothetical protein n=1 Tax=Agrobacterium pusense TaxID=648995 RepID=UPI00146B6715|nr:hypothetical protein [Agrobacterium pusense]WCK24160.1 hypothetical protein CFBP5496_0000725 [Agrobacterium pusense]
MGKVVNSNEYSANSIFVGCSVNEDGEPLVEINSKAIGTVAGLLDFLGKYEGQQKATVNVKWAAAVPPDGFLGPRDYKIASPHRPAAFFVDVPVKMDIEPGEDAYARIDKLQRRLVEMESTFAKRVEESIKSASIRNVRHHL